METKDKENPWERMARQRRKQLVWGLWFVTWLGLLAGLFDRAFYDYVVIFSVIHALLICYLVGFQLTLFPAQVRIAYLAWVAVGTYIPHMTVLMYITTVGLATNLFANYCPLARMLYLLPWNRQEDFSFSLLKRTFISLPVEGQFKPKP